MPTLSWKLLIGSTATLLAALLASIVILALSVLPFQYRQARLRWEQQRMRHYQVEVVWANGWNFGDARVEMRDNRLVQAIDLETGQSLARNKLLSAAYFGSIDNLFAIIEKRVQPSWNWRNLLARYVPSLARRIGSCAAPLGEVSYDPQYGYPTNLWYNDGWCTNTFFNYSNVKITQFVPLP
jgi:hypothetical protein